MRSTAVTVALRCSDLNGVRSMVQECRTCALARSSLTATDAHVATQKIESPRQEGGDSRGSQYARFCVNL
jgi:hypothetical protein